jgi:MFS family permease
MVQVDVFWSYGIGSGFALAAARQLQARRDGAEGDPEPSGLATNPYLLACTLYLALLFAPSGIWLLWGFPDWETMQVAPDHSALPAWLVACFAVTNISQGVLGFWVTERLILRGRRYLAFLNMVLGYFGMFFILVHGWDGRGYQRFLSANRAVFGTWPATPTAGDALSRAGAWVTSPVALTLAGMAVAIVPALLVPMVSWLRSGRRAGDRVPGAGALTGAILAAIFGLGLGGAVLTSVLVHVLGGWLGVLAAVAAGSLLLRPNWPAHRLYRVLGLAVGPVGFEPTLART